MSSRIVIDRAEGCATGPETTVFIAALEGDRIYLHAPNRSWSDVLRDHASTGRKVPDAAFQAIERMASEQIAGGNAATGRELFMTA